MILKQQLMMELVNIQMMDSIVMEIVQLLLIVMVSVADLRN
jgi:hypothetical protein